MIDRNSLALRLFAGAAVWALILLLIGAVALTFLFRQSVMGTLDERLTSATDSIMATMERDEDQVWTVRRPPTDPRYERIFSGVYWEIQRAQSPVDEFRLAASRSLWDETLHLTPRMRDTLLSSAGTTLTASLKGPDGEPLRLVVRGVRMPGEDGLILVIAAEDRRPADQAVRQFGFASLGMFFVFAAAIAAGVFVQVRIGLEPVLRMRKSVAEIREGLTRRVDGRYPAELQPLADELNAMIDHSQELVERSRTHVGNLAHALKTPIAVLTNESRTEGGEFAGLVERQTQIMSEQVDHHLRRARAAAHAKAIGARTEVGPLIEDLTRTLKKIYGREGVVIEAEQAEGLVFRGERQDLEEMVGNLADNACKWSNGLVQVTARPEDEHHFAVIVEDDGPGMSQDGYAQALGRGVRLDEQAPGSGLGLSIVLDLAKAYDGDIELSKSELGGLRACLILPSIKR
ncbi:sensor histidine kinase [Maricaulis sp. D1M11]|uniref:sensor histidine kinase n=1 Tax=Maricaulis sp. D1M11 TaxID=3076117 RepID=UPI0039B4A6FD